MVDGFGRASDLLGRHVERGSQRHARRAPVKFRRRLRRLRPEHLGDSEVHKLDEIGPLLAAADKDALGSQVAVNDAVLVRRREPA